MLTEINQSAQTIYNILQEKEFLSEIKKDFYWDINLGNSYYDYSYKNFDKIYGRNKEKEKFDSFMNSKNGFLVTGFLGEAGSGKSALAYNLAKNYKKYRTYAIDYNGLSKINYTQIKNNNKKNRKILIVIDYILLYAKEIGQWINTLYRSWAIKKRYTIRILLLERSIPSNDLPYWYLELRNALINLELKSICKYENFIKLSALDDTHLKNIFCDFIKKSMKKEKKEYNRTIIEKAFERIIPQIDTNCKKPLYIMAIADAWLNDNDIKQWDQEGILKHVVDKEMTRINALSNNSQFLDALKKILALTMAVYQITINEDSSIYLKNLMENLKNNYDKRDILFESLIGEYLDSDDCCIKFQDNIPDLIREYHCLYYLSNEDENILDRTFLKDFVNEAWKINPIGFASFLKNVISDFPYHKMSGLDKLFQMPDSMNDKKRTIYADLLREFAYCNTHVVSYREKLIVNFQKLLNDTVDYKNKTMVMRMYIISILNMSWHDTLELDNSEIRKKSYKYYYDQMCRICTEQCCDENCELCTNVKRSLECLKLEPDEMAKYGFQYKTAIE